MKNDIVLNLKMILENRAGRKREDGKGKMRDSTAGFREMLIPSRDGHERQEEKKVIWMTILSHLLMIARTYCLLWDF